MFILTFPVGKLKQEGFKMIWVLARIQTWKIWLISRPMLKLQAISLFLMQYFVINIRLFILLHMQLEIVLSVLGAAFSPRLLMQAEHMSAYVCLIHALVRMQTVHNKHAIYFCFFPA